MAGESVECMPLHVKLEFGGGAELLFNKVKKHEATLPLKNKPWTIRTLLLWIKTNLLKERPELFMQGETVRPGILVLVNDADWELLGQLDYKLQEGDSILFISTLHGDVIDFRDINCLDQANVTKIRECTLHQDNIPESWMYGLKPLQEWKMFELVEKPGLLFIPNPFSQKGQRYWVCRCLQDYPCKPDSRLNLDVHGDLGPDENWWEICQKEDNCRKELVTKLRWVTLGYHHNWDTKVYSESVRGQFPRDLAALSRLVASAAGFPNFAAQAAIINFYHMNSMLSGHTDHSEADCQAPLLSFSFGQSAVFLLGGPSLEEKPTAMFVHSGDIILMSGSSRLCYHGVPRVISAPKPSWDGVLSKSAVVERTEPCELVESICQNCTDDTFWKPFGKYLETSRINMNVRQVLYHGQNTL